MAIEFEQLAAAARRDSRTVSGAETRWLVDEVERLRRYERAMQSMAKQFICPRMTAEKLVEDILGSEAGKEDGL